MLRGDVKCNGLEHHAGYSRYGTTAWNPDGTGVTCKSKSPADADGTATFCRRETCKTLVELVWLAGARSASVVGETAARSILSV